MNKRLRPSWTLQVLRTVVALLITTCVSHAQNFNRPVPQGIPAYEFQRYDTTDLNSYYTCAPFIHNGGTSVYKALMVLDQNGYLAWWTASNRTFFDFKYHPDHNLYTYTHRKQGTIWHYVLNNSFEVVDSITVPQGYTDIHEFQIFPNGNYCFLGVNDTIVDLSGYDFNGNSGSATTHLADLVIWEFTPNHDLVLHWRAAEHLPIDTWVDDYPYNPNSFDYLHGNSIERDTDGNLIISMRTANAVYKIDHTTGDIIWRLGGNHSDFSFVDDNGFAGQHDARRNTNGNITIFDNQFLTTSGSRGVEYELDLTDSTASVVSEYSYNWPLNCYSLGSYRQMDNGYEIVGWGNTKRPEPSITLLDAQHNIATDLFFQDTVVTYRAFFQEFELGPDRPEITCNNDGNTLWLSAPSNHQYYLWSTGESTQTIAATDTGVYVVWVNQGIGSLGSEPLVVTDPVTHCLAVSSMDTEPEQAQPRSMGFFDLSGRRITDLTNGSIYLERFDNGKHTRRIHWD